MMRTIKSLGFGTLISSFFMAYSLTFAADLDESMLERERAAIEVVVESVGALADRNEYDALARLFADSFELDYSSLNGQEAAVTNPGALMDQWAGVLPGFDQTRHALSNVNVVISGNAATASADVVASHWVDELFWQVEGNYQYALERHTDGWKITSMTFNLEQESGTRDVFGPAIAAAREKPLPGYLNTIAARNKQTVKTFFNLLEQENIQGLVDLFAADGKQVNPYTGGVFPAGAEGHKALSDYWSPVPDNFDSMRFVLDALLATEDPNTVFVSYTGALKLKDGGGIYQNDYYSTFTFDRDGKIVEYVEIFDPVTAAKSFGLMDQLR